MHEDFNIVTQVAMVVKDGEAKAKVFAEIFGVDVPEGRLTGTLDEANTTFKGQPTEARAKLFFFEMGNLQIELIQPDGKPSTWQQYLDDNGEGIHHIAFHVKNMEGEIARLSGVGLELEQRGQYPGGEYAYLNGGDLLPCIFELLADR
jgi:catechol 2,3-dioxygenase-like lactoylglutathione lyase family enzyme